MHASLQQAVTRGCSSVGALVPDREAKCAVAGWSLGINSGLQKIRLALSRVVGAAAVRERGRADGEKRSEKAKKKEVADQLT